MSRYIAVVLFFIFTLVTYANTGNAFKLKLPGMSEDKSKDSGLGGLLKGLSKGGSQKGGSKMGGMGGMGGMFGNVQDMARATNLGPMGEFALGRDLSSRLVEGTSEEGDQTAMKGAAGKAKLGNTLGTTSSGYKDPRLGYLRNILITLLMESHSFSSYKEPTLVIINDKTPNAFAVAGGFFFVTEGMLNMCVDEDELAFVMAHETSHSELNHSMNSIRSAEAGKVFGEATKSMGIDTSSIFGAIMVQMRMGYNKEMEGEADTRGVEIAAAAGYDPQAALSAMRKLEKSMDKNHSTVGYPDDRAALIKAVIARIGSPTVDPKKKALRTARYKKFLN